MDSIAVGDRARRALRGRHDGDLTGRPRGAAELEPPKRAGQRIVAPNFAIGAVLMMRFAELAAPSCPAAEVIELHHDGKVDAPSGTALSTARRIAAARDAAPASPEAMKTTRVPGGRTSMVSACTPCACRAWSPTRRSSSGRPGQTLSIRHDTTDRSAFMPGVLLAVKAVSPAPGLTVGLDALLEDG